MLVRSQVAGHEKLHSPRRSSVWIEIQRRPQGRPLGDKFRLRGNAGLVSPSFSFLLFLRCRSRLVYVSRNKDDNNFKAHEFVVILAQETWRKKVSWIVTLTPFNFSPLGDKGDERQEATHQQESNIKWLPS